MTFLSLFAGIGGFDLGFERAGLECVGQVENDESCNEVLERHWPDVKRYGDIKEFDATEFRGVDVVCGGFPCQDLSVAGKRKGLAGGRSGLFWQALRVIAEARPQYVVIENVPGLLSSQDGRDMETVVRGLVELGYRVCWRVLDSQYFGVAQRRRRVFIVGSLGDGRCAEILFEPESLRGDSPPSREAGKRVADSLTVGANQYSGFSGEPVEVFQQNQREEVRTLGSVAGAVASEPGMHNQNFLVVDTTQITSKGNYSNPKPGDPCHPLAAGAHPPLMVIRTDQVNANGKRWSDEDISGTLDGAQGQAVAFTASSQANSYAWEKDYAPALDCQVPNDSSNIQKGVRIGSIVRRLTPTECARLQGFPDDWNSFLSDAAMYKQFGNAVTESVAFWLGGRLLSRT